MADLSPHRTDAPRQARAFRVARPLLPRACDGPPPAPPSSGSPGGRSRSACCSQRYAPACVIIDRNGEILYFHGRTDDYLVAAERPADAGSVGAGARTGCEPSCAARPGRRPRKRSGSPSPASTCAAATRSPRVNAHASSRSTPTTEVEGSVAGVVRGRADAPVARAAAGDAGDARGDRSCTSSSTS